jgi:glutathione S-transferase
LAEPQYRARNPFGQVPTLVIDGRYLTENVAILATLARLFPAAGILPSGDEYLHGLALSRLAICSSQLHPTLSRIMSPERFCDFSAEAKQRTREQAATMMTGRLTALEPTLRDKPWWLGDAFSIADVYLSWITNLLGSLGVDLGNLPVVKAHLERVKATEVMRRVLALETRYLAELESDGSKLPEHIKAMMAL